MYHRYQRSMRLMEMRIEAEQEVAREVDMAASEELQNMGFLSYLDPEVSTNSNTTNNNAEDTANSNTNTNSNTAEDVLSEPPTKKRKLK